MPERALYVRSTGLLTSFHKYCSVAAEGNRLQSHGLQRAIAVFETVELSCAFTLRAKQHNRDMAALKGVSSKCVLMPVPANKRSWLELISQNESHNSLSQQICAAHQTGLTSRG